VIFSRFESLRILVRFLLKFWDLGISLSLKNSRKYRIFEKICDLLLIIICGVGAFENIWYRWKFEDLKILKFSPPWGGVLNILKAPSPKYLYTAAFNFFSWSRDTIPLIPPRKRPPVCEKKLGYRATPPIGYTAWHPIRQGAQPMRGQPVYGQNEPETESANSTPCPDAENHHHQASGIKNFKILS